jgi:hypothetical protein
MVYNDDWCVVVMIRVMMMVVVMILRMTDVTGWRRELF